MIELGAGHTLSLEEYHRKRCVPDREVKQDRRKDVSSKINKKEYRKE